MGKQVLEMNMAKTMESFDYQVLDSKTAEVKTQGSCNFYVLLGATKNEPGVIDVMESFGGYITEDIAVSLICSMRSISDRLIDSFEQNLTPAQFSSFMYKLSNQLAISDDEGGEEYE